MEEVMEKLHYEDYTIGEKLKSPGRTITETDIVMFSAFTGDWHPLHTNVEFAKKTIFGERIAHGMLTLCVGSALMFRLGLYAALPKSFIAFYGMDSVRFTGATKIGDTINCELEVTGMDAKDDQRGVITAKNSIKNQKGEDLVIYTTKFMCGRRPKA